MSDIEPISSVVTTLSIIEAMVDHGEPVGVSELAKIVGVNKPRTYRHLRTLVQRQYVVQDADTGNYNLTLKLFRLGESIAAGISFVNEARRVMPELRQRTGMTVTIGQVEEDGVRILDILKQRTDIEITTPPGTLFDFHCSAQGKVALAFGPERLLDEVTKQNLQPRTSHTNTNSRSLRSEVCAVARSGWAVAPEESLIGINALAAPIFDAASDLAGTITIVGSIQHLPAKPDTAVIAAVRRAAAEISSRLGYRKVASG